MKSPPSRVLSENESPLSAKEIELMRAICITQHSHKELAHSLGLSYSCVGQRIKIIYRKLEISGMLSIMVYALQHGLVKIEEIKLRKIKASYVYGP